MTPQEYQEMIARLKYGLLRNARPPVEREGWILSEWDKLFLKLNRISPE